MIQQEHTNGEPALELQALRERVQHLEAERQRLDGALAESQARFQAFLDHSPTGAFIKDEEGRYLYVNRQFQQLCQRGPEQLVGQFDTDLFPPELARRLLEHDARVRGSGRPLEVIEQVPSADGPPSSWLVCKFLFGGNGRQYLGGFAVDITERQRAEEVLRERDAWLHTLIANVPGAVYRCGYGPDWTIHYISDAIETISGYPASDFIRSQVRDFVSIIHPADWPAVERQAIEAIARRQPYDVEYRILHRQGGVRWVHERGQAIHDSAGDILWLDGVILDVTHRKRDQEALRQQQQIISQLHNAVFVADLQGYVQSCNAAVERLTGYRIEELIGKHLSLFYPLEDGLASSARTLQRVLQQGVTEEETWVQQKSGERVLVHLSMALLRGDDGTASGMVGQVVDITQRYHIENKLRESEEFHRLIADLSYDYAYSCSVDAGGTIRLESVTEGFAQVTGYTLEELKARGDWVALIHPEDLPKAVENDPLGEGRRVFELRILTKAGKTRWIRYSTHALRDPQTGRVQRLIGAVHDITEQKLAEQQLREYANKHQSLSRRLLEVQEDERRHLARELHDEIGQELTGLQYALEMGRLDRPEEVHSSLTKARGMVKDLMVRVRELSMGLRPTLLDDMGLFPALRWLFQRYSAQTGVQVDFEQEGRERRLVPALETAAYRIIQEALTNVARHAGVRQVQVRIRLDEQRLEIQVVDRGVGFAPQLIASRGGTSGLSGMHERAGLLNGRLDIESAPGAGTRLTVHLPIAELHHGNDHLPGR